jgi:hypothetical protein
VQKCDNIARQLDAAAADMAKMAMDYADLGEQLQVGAAAARQARGTRARHLLRFFFFAGAFLFSLPPAQLSKIERMQLQVLCGDVVQEFNAASVQVRGPSRRVTVLRASVDQQRPTPPPLCPHPPPHPSAPTHPPTPSPFFPPAVGHHRPLNAERENQSRERGSGSQVHLALPSLYFCNTLAGTAGWSTALRPYL